MPKTTTMREEVKQKALELAKQKGKLTYDDLNEILPADGSSGDISKDIDEMMVMLSGMDIDVVDDLRVDAETRQIEKQKEKQAKRQEARRDAAQTRLERADDPVRMYLREMGRVPLLTKDQEVAIAKRIEAAENDLTELLLSTPYTLKEIGMLAARILAGRLSFGQISEIEEPKLQDKFLKRLPALMNEMSEYDALIEVQEKRARRSGLSAKSRRNIADRVGEYRALQADLVREFHLKNKEIMKIARKIKSLKRRIATSRDEIDRVEREVGFDAHEIHKMAVQLRRSQSAAQKLGVDRDAILDAERRLGMAQRKVDQIESDAKLNTDEITRPHRHDQGEGGEHLQRQDGAGGSEPAPRGQHRQEVYEPRHVLPRSDSGRQHRPYEGGGQVRISARLQVQHLRHVVDSPGHHPVHRGPGPHHPHPGAYDRIHQQARAHQPTPGAGVWPRAQRRRDRRRDGRCPRTRSAAS